MITTYLAHRGLSAPTFAAALVVSDPPGAKEIFVKYDGIGTARVQVLIDAASAGLNAPPTKTPHYSVWLNGTVLATARSGLTLTDLDTLVGFTSESLTIQEEITDLEARVTALENA